MLLNDKRHITKLGLKESLACKSVHSIDHIGIRALLCIFIHFSLFEIAYINVNKNVLMYSVENQSRNLMSFVIM